MQKILYVGLDVHKVSISVTVAEDGREGKVNFVGTIPNSPIALTKLAVEHRAAEDCSSMAFFASDVASAQPASGSRSMAAALGSDRLHSTCCGDATANRKARARHG
jgi:hypothetical protein